MGIEPVVWNVFRLDNIYHLGVLWTISSIASALKLFYQKVCRKLGRSDVVFFPRTSPESAPVTNLACIVTGASSGIGKVTAEALALRGYHVILAGRSVPKLLEVVTELKKKHSSISVEALQLDLVSVESILSFKNAVETSLSDPRHNRELQLLVNNAGILAFSQRWTPDGFDSMIATNYLGPFLLTQQLLPLLQKSSAPARIVTVVSFAHRSVTSLKVDEKELAKGTMQTPELKGDWYRLAHIYETSKFCLLVFTYELHRRFFMSIDSSKITALAADPGINRTNIMRDLPGWFQWIIFLGLRVLRILQNPEVGASAVIDAALAPEGVSGKYFCGGQGRVLQSSPLSYDPNLSKQIWETTSSLLSKTVAQHSKDQQ